MVCLSRSFVAERSPAATLVLRGRMIFLDGVGCGGFDGTHQCSRVGLITVNIMRTIVFFSLSQPCFAVAVPSGLSCSMPLDMLLSCMCGMGDV